MTTATFNTPIRQELQGIGSDLKWSAVELSRIADRLDASGNASDAQAIQRMIQVFQQGEARLLQIAESMTEREAC